MLEIKDYKIALGISPSDTSLDELLSTYKDRIEEKVKLVLGRDLDTKEYVEYLNGTGDYEIVPSQFPITTVSKTEVYNGLKEDNTEDWIEYVIGVDYERLITDNLQSKVILTGAVFPVGIQNIRLTYTAGYETVPSPVKMICEKLMKLYYSEIKEDKLGVSSKTKSSGQSNETISYDLKAEEKILSELSRYKDINI